MLVFEITRNEHLPSNKQTSLCSGHREGEDQCTVCKVRGMCAVHNQLTGRTDLEDMEDRSNVVPEESDEPPKIMEFHRMKGKKCGKKCRKKKEKAKKCKLKKGKKNKTKKCKKQKAKKSKEKKKKNKKCRKKKCKKNKNAKSKNKGKIEETKCKKGKKGKKCRKKKQ